MAKIWVGEVLFCVENDGSCLLMRSGGSLI
jgi:hypothetical protein